MTSARYKEYISKYNLRRFVDAHRQIYSSALNEIRSSEKQSHWMWLYFHSFEDLGIVAMLNIMVLQTVMKW